MPASGPAGGARSGGGSARAERAGHSVAVLLQIYAKCIAGQEDAARRHIAQALAGSEG